MGKLTEWVEQNTTITQEKFNENDITMNEYIRGILFDQIEDLAFKVEDMKVIRAGAESKRQYLISFRLDYPRKTETPYSFIFETGTRALIPQYTITHRVYHAPMDSEEYKTLSNLESYLIQCPTNDVKSNPANQRDRSQHYLLIQGTPTSDVVIFNLKNYSYADSGQDLNEAIGKFVVKYIDADGKDKIVAYQNSSGNFMFTPEYRDLRISKRERDGVLEYYLYNIPQFWDYCNFTLEAHY